MEQKNNPLILHSYPFTHYGKPYLAIKEATYEKCKKEGRNIKVILDKKPNSNVDINVIEKYLGKTYECDIEQFKILDNVCSARKLDRFIELEEIEKSCTYKPEFNKEIKDKVNELIIEAIEKYDKENKKINNILILETENFSFIKKFPDKKFYIAEENKEIYKKMIMNQPENVKKILYGDVGDWSIFNENFDCIYLDFMKNIKNNINSIEKLKDKINNAQIVIINSCNNFKEDKSSYDIYLFETLSAIINFNNFATHTTHNYEKSSKYPMHMIILIK